MVYTQTPLHNVTGSRGKGRPAQHYPVDGQHLTVAQIMATFHVKKGKAYRIAHAGTSQVPDLRQSRRLSLDHGGHRRSINEWAQTIQVSPSTIRRRLKLGWDIARVLLQSTPKRLVTMPDGTSLTVARAAAQLGLTRQGLYHRLWRAERDSVRA